MSLFGVDGYEVEYLATVRALQHFYEYWSMEKGASFGEEAGIMQRRELRGGEKVHLTGTLTFQKTERVWKGEDGTLY